MSTETLQLQKGIIYGPVNSRRLGSSLGLNILPTAYKACPFNCAYCQYGFTAKEGYLTEYSGKDMPSTAAVVAALEEAFIDYPSVAYLTFSGNGEPTLHPEFAEIVRQVKQVKNRVNPEIKLAILSNSALAYKPEVRKGLELLDVRFMKLDAGDEKTFRRFNRPHPSLSLEKIISGLKGLKNIIIQSLFAGGDQSNFNDFSVEKWIDKIGEIRPMECHIYSLDRPSADSRLVQIDRTALISIKKMTEDKIGIPVRVF